MNTKLILAILTLPAAAHVSYSGRDFGSFQADGSEAPVVLNTSVSSTFGWADGTDGDFGDSHRLRAFRFTLENAGTVALAVTGADGFLPAFSIYSGLVHLSPELLSHDSSALSVSYLAGLGGDPKEGAFVALGDWSIGNDPVLDPDDNSIVLTPASLRSLGYIGHAADGTSGNFGSAPGISGDGLADGFASGSFHLPAGDYSIFIGGADYFTQAAGPYPSFPVTATLTVVPEPSACLLAVLSTISLGMRRVRGGREVRE